MNEWDHTVDVICLGSGGGGLTAALAVRDAGGDALVIEKRDLVGGSTAMSGGVIWLPNNPIMRADGIVDSDEEGLKYFESVVGDVGPASSVARRRTYLSEGRETVKLLQRRGIDFLRCPGYSDYYPDHPGGNAEGRSIEPAPFDGKRLGSWLPRLQPGMAAAIGLAVKTNELRSLQYYNRSVGAFVNAARVWLRTYASKLVGKRLLTNGAALIGAMLKASLDSEVKIWTGVEFSDFVTEQGAVVGVRVIRDGTTVTVRARGGVLVSSGGFAHNREMREKFSGSQPVTGEWSVANPGDTGEIVMKAMELGAATDLLDEAWWLPGPDNSLASSTLGQGRQRAGSIIVDASGSRFVNESNSYVEVGKAMFVRDPTAKAVPSWLVFDDGYRRRYANAKSLPGRFDPEWIRSGVIKRADSLEDLAKICDIDPVGLAATVRKFNAAAACGTDPEFGRGANAYNRCLGDPGRVPNPCLAPIVTAPYYATLIYPKDVGTCGGLLADEYARVLDERGEPIAGLYATGNSTATIMGRRYLGAGASIGYSMVFGYIAAKHAMTRVGPEAKGGRSESATANGEVGS